MPNFSTEGPTEEKLQTLVAQLLEKDPDAHEAAIQELAQIGDERVIPHLVDVATIHAIATDWETFGFPEFLQQHTPPRYLRLPETSWPGAVDALNQIAEPTFTGKSAWLNWETWYSQQDITGLDGLGEWKKRLWWSYVPSVGHYLKIEPRTDDLEILRWGNTERSLLAPLNAPDFGPADKHQTYKTDDGELIDYPGRHSTVFGFVIEETAYAVPRWVQFPHELLNADLDGHPVSLTYCTVCNSPVLYDRMVAGRRRTFGSTGLVHKGNKVMFDEETQSLWNQQTGEPMAGRAVEADWNLDLHPVTMTDWKTWSEKYPDSYILDPDTGHNIDYTMYQGEIGFIRHYWENDNVVAPGVRVEEGELAEKTYVYGIEDGTNGLHLFPIDKVEQHDFLTHEIDGQGVIAVHDSIGDVAIYESPGEILESDGNELIQQDGSRWEITYDSLVNDERTLPRIPGHHGFYFAFRSHYEYITIVTP